MARTGGAWFGKGWLGEAWHVLAGSDWDWSGEVLLVVRLAKAWRGRVERGWAR